MPEPVLHYKYKPEVKELLGKLCDVKEHREAYITIFPRFGLSGAKLLLVHFQKPNTLPYLFKIAPAEKAQREYDALSVLSTWVRECRSETAPVTTDCKTWSGVLYNHAGTDKEDDAENSLTLRELLYAPEGTCALEEILQIINSSYEKLRNPHSEFELREVNVEDVYRSYFRQDKSRQRISNILGADSLVEQPEFLGATIHNPLIFRKSLPKEVNIGCGSIHGDLHPDNIVLNVNKAPNLIDFAWASPNKDVLLDYVLFECSIRFKEFQRSFNLESQLLVDELLLEEDGWQEIKDLKFSNASIKANYVRMAAMVGEVRSIARKILGASYCFEKYLFCQFIVLYGLIKYDSFEAFSALRALGLIAKKLNESDYRTLLCKR